MKGLIFFWLCFALECCAQKQNNVWCFGDSVGIDFNSGNATTFSSGMDGRGSCVSIADTNGQLLFYAFTRTNMADPSCRIFNNLHQLMQNGDSIIGEGWYNELAIVNVGNGLFYLFSMGEVFPSQRGFYYSLIDMNLNGGLGQVIQKNIQLNSLRNADCVTAVKHGNGRDWWVISKYSTGNGSTTFNRFYVFQINSTGVSLPIIQDLNNAHDGDNQKLIFNSDGTKIIQINFYSLIAEYDFDRCTGIISNQNIISPEDLNPKSSYFFTGAYSPDNSKLYISTDSWTNNDSSLVLQFDLNATNIWASCDTLFSIEPPVYSGVLTLAPDKKIYYSCYYNYGFPGYPYPDSVYNMYNMNLSVINHPDSLGTACDFQAFSLNLGGKRTYYGLPHNPNYDLGPMQGSICDTLTSLFPDQVMGKFPELNVTYQDGWHKLFVNVKKLSGCAGSIKFIDLEGRELLKILIPIESDYFTYEINCSQISSGIYFVKFESKTNYIVRKILIN